MNRNMNLPAIQRIAMDFERENDLMEQRQEMMDDAIDDTFEDEEEESDEIINQVLDEVGIDLSQSVLFHRCTRTDLKLGETPHDVLNTRLANVDRVPEAIGADDDLQARLDSLRK
jgi:charged multivesicular body protein 2A